jgi:hypothetical protein
LKKYQKAVEDFYDSCTTSGLTYTPEEMHEAIRIDGQSTNHVKQLFRKLEARKSKEVDEGMGGEAFHSADRHIAISDKDMEARLRGTGGWDQKQRATRIASTDNANRAAIKLLRLIKPEVQKYLREELRTVPVSVLSLMQEGSFAILNSNKAKKDHIKDEVGLRDKTEYPLGDDHGTITVMWNVTPLANGSIKLRCTYEVTSSAEFEKEVWSLDPEDDSIIKEREYAPLTMYSGQNSPEIEIDPTDDSSIIAAKVASIDLDKIGVTMY